MDKLRDQERRGTVHVYSIVRARAIYEVKLAA